MAISEVCTDNDYVLLASLSMETYKSRVGSSPGGNVEKLSKQLAAAKGMIRGMTPDQLQARRVFLLAQCRDMVKKLAVPPPRTEMQKESDKVLGNERERIAEGRRKANRARTLARKAGA